MLALHTHEEVVVPTWSDGMWIARCRHASARDALVRRFRFVLVSEAPAPEDEPAGSVTAGVELHGLRRGPAVVGGLASLPFPPAQKHGEPDERDRSRPDAGVAWAAWRVRRDALPADPTRPARDVRRALDVLRAPPALDLAVAASSTLAEGGTGAIPPVDVSVVLGLHGLVAADVAATERASASVAALGPAARLVLAQNEPTVGSATRDLARRVGADPKVQPRNDGFADLFDGGVCHALRKMAKERAPRWLLLTQADVTWGAREVALAAALGEAVGAASDGQLPIVGPSGGYLVCCRRAQLAEWGRQVGHWGDARFVDWVAGYWLLVPTAAYLRAGGFWRESFLYFEEPDLCLRAAFGGARSIAWPGIRVDHGRAETSRATMARVDRLGAQAEAALAFSRRWGAFEGPGLPPEALRRS